MFSPFQFATQREHLLAVVLALVLWSPGSKAADPGVECAMEVAKQEKFESLRSKISLTGAKDQTFAMLVDKSLASEEDKKAIVQWMTERETCWRSSIEWRDKNVHPLLRSISERNFNELNRLVADLYLGKISFGEFASKRSEFSSEQRRQWDSTIEQLNSGKRAEAERLESSRQQAEIERQRLYADQINNQSQYKPYELPMFMQAPPPIKSPTTTTCETVGGRLVCRTQ
jgi:hypothetical protein